MTTLVHKDQRTQKTSLSIYTISFHLSKEAIPEADVQAAAQQVLDAVGEYIVYELHRTGEYQQSRERMMSEIVTVYRFPSLVSDAVSLVGSIMTLRKVQVRERRDDCQHGGICSRCELGTNAGGVSGDES